MRNGALQADRLQASPLPFRVLRASTTLLPVLQVLVGRYWERTQISTQEEIFIYSCTVVATVFEDRFYGLTVNAFCSASLDPPLVLISPENGSQTLGVLRQSQVFSVNILTNQQ
jgi:hypothetical protein